MLYWITQKLSDVPFDDHWLSSGEITRLREMRFPKRRNDWKLGRWTAKCALSRYLESIERPCRLPRMEIRAASDGAPEAYLQEERLSIGLSISHSMDTGFCVVSPDDPEVGCDLEWIQSHDENFVEDYFSKEEKAFVERIPIGEHPLYITLIWSAKESALKSLRQGLRRDTRSVVARVDSNRRLDQWNDLRADCTEPSRTFFGWWRIRDGFIHTITVTRPGEEPIELTLHHC